MTFNGTELKYFKNQSDKDKSSRNIIPLAEMIDVKKVPDVSVFFCRSMFVRMCLSSNLRVLVVITATLQKNLAHLFFPQDDKMNRFDLVVINRVFQFSADSLEDSQVWISVLHAAISRFKPQEVKDGGIMSDPDRQGFILKQGHGPFAKFKERQASILLLILLSKGCGLYCKYMYSLDIAAPKYIVV